MKDEPLAKEVCDADGKLGVWNPHDIFGNKLVDGEGDVGYDEEGGTGNAEYLVVLATVDGGEQHAAYYKRVPGNRQIGTRCFPVSRMATVGAIEAWKYKL